MTTKQGRETEDEPVHVSVVLDRSGSMSPIADDVVGGFNEFLADQRKQQGRARITLVQFDSQDPFELLIDGVDLTEVEDLRRSQYQPRGTTPLYDAVGRMIGKIDAGIAGRAEQGTEEEDQVVVIITDGLENSSREHTRSSVFDLIEARRAKGWVFVFLGANQDAYAAGEAMAVSAANAAMWAATPEGSKKMWAGISAATGAHRAKSRSERATDADRFLDKDREKGGPSE